MAADSAGAVEQVRAAVAPLLASGNDALRAWCDDACVRRYLRARDGSVPKASAMLRATIAWRQGPAQPGRAVCAKCAASPHAHNLRLVGFDEPGGRPVLYTDFGNAHDRFEPRPNTAHMIAMLENTAAVMARRGASGVRTAETWVWFVDFNGYALRDNSPTTMVLTAQLLAHYPERLGLVVMHGAPWLFGASWAVVRKLLNEVTASKIEFIKAGDGAALRGLSLGREITEWLQAECAENSAGANASGSGAAPPADAKCYWEGCDCDGVPKAHDSRGAATHVGSEFFTPLVASTRGERGGAASEGAGATAAAIGGSAEEQRPAAAVTKPAER